MKIELNNIGKINKSSIVVEGITVIAGSNNTGKSTVSKALCSILMCFYNLQEKIENYRIEYLESIIEAMLHSSIFSTSRNPKSTLIEFNQNIAKVDKLTQKIRQDFSNILLLQNKTDDELLKYIQKELEICGLQNTSADVVNSTVKHIKRLLKISDNDIKKVVFHQIFKMLFSKQVSNIYNKAQASISLNIKDHIFSVSFKDDKISKIEEGGFNINKKVIYLDNPLLDLNSISINNNRYGFVDELVDKLNNNKESNPINLIMHNQKISSIFEKLRQINIGSLINDGSDIVYRENNKNQQLDLLNVSQGLKSFILLKELLEKEIIEENSTIILDEPEVHLHPEWQIIFAELIVLLYKILNVHVLLTTHSPYFLRAIDVCAHKYDVQKKCNYYLSSFDDKQDSFEIKNVNKNKEEIYKKLIKPFQDLENDRWN